MAGKISCNNINTIPLDLKVEILNKLPTKYLERFQCVSKQWKSIIKDIIVVIDSIVTRSSLTQQPSRDPHFIFNRRDSKYKTPSIFSYVHDPHQITNQEQQLYHEEICGRSYAKTARFQYVRGLVGFWCSSNSGMFRIYNPTTSQTVSLPDLPPPNSKVFYLFGYDPLENQYKVVRIIKGNGSCQVFTLGDPNKKWMKLQCSIGSHSPCGIPVCINGTIYFKTTKRNLNRIRSHVLFSFDVRSQRFNHVQDTDNMLINHKYSNLINYQGKLAGICRNKTINEDVDMWVMENADKQEWSKVTLYGMLHGLTSRVRFADVGGEVVVVRRGYRSEHATNVYYYDLKQNIRRRVEIQTTMPSERLSPGDYFTMWPITDHVENIMSL